MPTADEVREALEYFNVTYDNRTPLWKMGLILTARVRELEAKLRTAKTVYAVSYSNYYPLEVESIWSAKELAIARRDSKNDIMWNVVEIQIDAAHD